MIRRIREVLRFEAQRAMAGIRNSPFPLDRAIQKVAGVKLDPGLIGQNLQHAPTARLIDFRCLRKFAAAAIEYPIVIVAMAFFQLIVIIVNSCAHGGRLAEIVAQILGPKDAAGIMLNGFRPVTPDD